MRRIGILFLLLTLASCDWFIPPPGGNGTPTVSSVTPSKSATNVSVGASVIAQLSLPNGGINQTSVSDSSVRLVNTATNAPVSANVMVLNDQETLTLDPSSQLEYGTTYRFELTSGVSDASGATFGDYSSTFTTVSADVPSVTSSTPADGAVDVSLDAGTSGISTVINTPLGGLDTSTLTTDSVYLEKVDGERVLTSAPTTSGGGDTIILQSSRLLEPNTTYRFNVTSAVEDDGVPFTPYTSTFTTTSAGGSEVPTISNIVSTKQPGTTGTRYSSLTFGPDGNLYALTILGEIQRFPVAADGTLETPTTISSLQQAEGGPRLAIGLTFDPSSTANNLIAWVTNTYIDVNNFDGSVGNGINQPWAGKVTRLSGPNLENVQDVVVGLPRSSKDHVTNSIAFNPAEPGVLYFMQGSNTAMGAPDAAWKYQEERALSGAVLRLDTNLLGNLPLNAQTEDGGNYNPFAPGAPLTVYASGTRNSYDLVWHSNGNLYVPANGSAGGGNIPRYDPLPGTCDNRIDGKPYTGPMLASPSAVNASYSNDRTDGWKITETLNDYLFNIEKGGYYGTPNPKRCEWILNGGAVGFPGEFMASTQRPEYPAGTSYDPNYRGPAGDFGNNVSPDGAIEYTGSAFPDLKGKLLVTRYSRFDDIVAVTLGSDGNATSIDPIISKQEDLLDPIDIAQSPTTGYLYVSWFDQKDDETPNARPVITLLRPK